MKSRRVLQKWFQPIMRYVVVLFVRDILYYVFANLEEESFCIVTLTQTRNTLTNRLQTNMLFGWKANFFGPQDKKGRVRESKVKWLYRVAWLRLWSINFVYTNYDTFCQRDSDDKLRAAIDVGQKHYRPKQLK